MRHLVYGIFRREQNAARAIEELTNADFPPEDLTVLYQDDAGVIERAPVQQRPRVGRGALVGAALGAVGGAVVLTSLGLFAAGPLLAALEAAYVGGATGTAAGALLGLGFWKEEAELPTGPLGEGAIFVGALTDTRQQDAERVLHESGADETHVRQSPTGEELRRAS